MLRSYVIIVPVLVIFLSFINIFTPSMYRVRKPREANKAYIKDYPKDTSA